jgi:hypothetical protein
VAELVERIERLDAWRELARMAAQAEERARQRERARASAGARRPWVLASVLASVLAMALGTAASLRQLSAARASARQAEAASREASAVNAFLVRDLLASSDLSRVALDEAPTLLTLLQRASSGLERRFEGQPLVEAAIRVHLGRAYNRLWSTTLAFPEYRRAIALRAPLVPADDELLAIMRLEHAQLHCRSGDTADCVALYHEAVRPLPPPRLERPDALGVLEMEVRGQTLQVSGQAAAALRAAHACVALADAHEPADLASRANARLRLGHTLAAQDDQAGAEAVVSALLQAPFAGTPQGLAVVSRLRMLRAARYRDSGDHAAAQALLLDVVRSLEPPAQASAWHRGDAHSGLGHVYRAWGRPRQADAQYAMAAAHFAQGLGRGHQFTWITQLNRAQSLIDDGRPAEALAVAQEARLPARVSTLRGQLTVNRQIARALIGTGRAAEAAQLLTRHAQAAALLRPEQPVPRVPQPRHDVAVVVQPAVDGRGEDGHVRVVLLHVGNALGRGHQADEADGAWRRLLQPLHRGHGAVAGGQHGVEHDGVTLGHVVRHLEVVLHRAQRPGVAVQADVAHARARHHFQHAVQEAAAGAHDHHEHRLLAVDHRAEHGLQRGLDGDHLRGHVARDLVAHQHADLVQQAAEAAGAAVLLADQRELVLYQRMVDDVDGGGGHGVGPQGGVGGREGVARPMQGPRLHAATASGCRPHHEGAHPAGAA